MIEEPERWLPVVGYEGLYDVSSLGRVRSLRRPRILKVFVNWNGYLRVNLTRDGKPLNHYVHRLVCRAFNGEPGESQLVVMHLNNDPADNRTDNLRWGTQKENLAQRDAERRHPHSWITHCPQGHGYTPENTYMSGTHRKCRTCVLSRQKLARERRKNDR